MKCKWLKRYFKSRMINTSITQNFLLHCELKHHKIADRFCFQRNRKTAISKHVCVNHYILILKYLSNHLHFITNGFKRFSTRPIQGNVFLCQNSCISFAKLKLEPMQCSEYRSYMVRTRQTRNVASSSVLYTSNLSEILLLILLTIALT